MEYVPSCFYVTFQEYRDRSVDFTVWCEFISKEPIGGMYQRRRLNLLEAVPYSRYDNNYPRIVNLCVPSRMNGISVSPEAIDYDSFLSNLSFYKRELFRYEFGFILAEDKRRFARALDHYGICYDYNTLLADLPF